MTAEKKAKEMREKTKEAMLESGLFEEINGFMFPKQQAIIPQDTPNRMYLLDALPQDTISRLYLLGLDDVIEKLSEEEE